MNVCGKCGSNDRVVKNYCHGCRTAYNKAYYLKNREKLIAYDAACKAKKRRGKHEKRGVRICPVCELNSSYFTHGSYGACSSCQQDNRYIFQALGRQKGMIIAKRNYKTSAFLQKLLRTLPAGISTNHVYGSDPR